MRILINTTTTVALLALSTLAFAHGEHAGHGTPTPTAYGEPGDPAKPAREVIVIMKEVDGRMLFVPNVVSVAAGEQVRFRLRNEGVLAHEFLLGTPAEIEEHADLMKVMPDMVHEDPNSKRVEASVSADLLWRFTKVGEFDFACLIPGHREAGMIGKVVVR
jgi:uncharacterized cupredoxin-like copper-binding protein